MYESISADDIWSFFSAIEQNIKSSWLGVSFSKLANRWPTNKNLTP